MKICDRCEGRDKVQTAVFNLEQYSNKGVVIDLCANCREDIKSFVQQGKVKL